MPTSKEFQDRMLSLGLARVSEAAALASAKLIGKGDEKAALRTQFDAIKSQSFDGERSELEDFLNRIGVVKAR